MIATPLCPTCHATAISFYDNSCSDAFHIITPDRFHEFQSDLEDFTGIADAAPVAPGWRTMDTLPHDGDEGDRRRHGQWYGPVLLYIPVPHGGVMFVAQMDSDTWIVEHEWGSFAPLKAQPTHWMPLPAPPPADGAPKP